MPKLLLDTLKGHPSDRVPFWFMRQAGRYLPEYKAVRATTSSFMEFCYSPEKAAEVTLQPLRRFDMDGAILFADILVVPDGLGQKVWFEAGHGPRLEAIQSQEGLAILNHDDFHTRVGNVYRTIEILKSKLPEEKTLIGFAGAPWTVATYMVEGAGSRDHGTARQLGYGNPEFFAQLLYHLVEATSEYLIAQIDAGVDAVQIFDSWAAALPEPAFQAWVIEPTKAIVEAIRAKHPEVPIIGFPRLAGTQLENYLEATGVEGLSLDPGVNLGWAAQKLGTKACLQGNLDPHLVVAGGKPMLAEAERILTALKAGPHIFNLGHGFVPETPIENVEELSKFIKDFRR